ncbi:hypothetical protein KAR91_80920 [Candidatus Pacearchaeota archaeon]|nr:hypothetical protein [Candidatus Pacearchaeota archaeon]
MKVTKLKAGSYKVEIGNSTIIVRGGANYNPDSKFFRNGGFEAWNANTEEECKDVNCWACGAPSKKVMLQWIQEDYDNGHLA